MINFNESMEDVLIELISETGDETLEEAFKDIISPKRNIEKINDRITVNKKIRQMKKDNKLQLKNDKKYMTNQIDLERNARNIEIANLKSEQKVNNAINKARIKKMKESPTTLEYQYDDIDSLFDNFFGESMKSGNPDIPDSIEDTINIIESKGYKVKYSSPGYANTRFKSDRNKDKVIYNKFISTGRVIFSYNYKFTETPKYWEWKALNNGTKALYVKPFTYNKTNGDKNEAFAKWKQSYLNELRKWAVSLPKAGTQNED